MIKKTKNSVTIKDLAIACDVSIATVSRVLNNKIGCCSADTEARILQIAKDMGYSPNVMARSLVTQKTGLVAALVPDIHYYYYQEFYFGLEEYFNQYGIRLLLCNTQEKQEEENQFIGSLSNGLVDGMIVSTLNHKENNDSILRLVSGGMPIVTVERFGDEIKGICNVSVDNRHAGKIAAEYLCSKGHKRIAFICGPKGSVNSELRLEGYKDGLKTYNVEIDADLIIYGDYQFDKSTQETMKLLKEKDFTAIIAANDFMCTGACKAIVKMHKKIPQDISVIGLGATTLTEQHQPKLTAISFNGYEMGLKAGECLKSIIDGNELEQKEIVFKPGLRIGKSVQEI